MTYRVTAVPGSKPILARGNGFVPSAHFRCVSSSLRRRIGTVAKTVRDRLFVKCSMRVVATRWSGRSVFCFYARRGGVVSRLYDPGGKGRARSYPISEGRANGGEALRRLGSRGDFPGQGDFYVDGGRGFPRVWYWGMAKVLSCRLSLCPISRLGENLIGRKALYGSTAMPTTMVLYRSTRCIATSTSIKEHYRKRVDRGAYQGGSAVLLVSGAFKDWDCRLHKGLCRRA